MFNRIVSLVVATSLTLGATVGHAQEQRYNYPRMIEALASNQMGQLESDDRNKSEAIASYLIGFTLWVDRSCDFLPMETFKRLEKSVVDMNEASQRGDGRKRQLLQVVRDGFADAKQFVAVNGCATRASKSAIASLGQLFRS